MAYDVVIQFLLAWSPKKGYLEKAEIAPGLPAHIRDPLECAGTVLQERRLARRPSGPRSSTPTLEASRSPGVRRFEPRQT